MNAINRSRRAPFVAAIISMALLASIATVARADDAPANVAGTWQFSADSSQGTFTATLTIEQNGGTIKGTQKSDFGDAPVTGTVTGNAIQFSVTVNSPNGSFTVTHDGTVTGDTMKGTFKINDNSGSWSATRQAPK
jgi:hypothetical protein